MENTETQDYLYPFLFRYNTYNKQWIASTNEKDLWNDLNSEEVISSSKIETLVELINKYQGDIKKLKKELK